MLKPRWKSQFEQNDGIAHPDFEVRNTRVSEYLRKYGQGKLETLPTDTRTEVKDDRSVDEMLNDDFEPGLGTDELDVLMEINRNKERFAKMEETIADTKADHEKFQAAMKVLNDANSSIEAKQDAQRILFELEQKKRITRARD